VINQQTLSSRKIEVYNKNSKIIKYWRRNPIIACEQLLGIKLMDAQKYILQQSWNTPHVVWCCSRNFGKSFLGAVFMILKALLYENQSIYIISSVGEQSKETFTKIEEIVLKKGKTSNSILSLKDIAMMETVKSPACQTGFSHAQTGYHVQFYNGSEIFTLNGNPDNNRSKRASLVFFDEAGFSSDELIAISEAFATQNSDFKTSINEDFNIDTLRKSCPTQLIYASSASHVDTTFYRHYKDFAKQMFLGNTDYFCCDIPCEIPLHPTIDGKESVPLLEQSKVDSAMRANRDKAMREYYNKFSIDGGESQIIKWAQIRRNETIMLPELYNKDNNKYIMAFDPARMGDNSIINVMKVKYNEDIGYYGEIVNCTNLVDICNKKGLKMSSSEQIKILKQQLLNYNGNAPDYDNIINFYIDPGAGGGGVSAFGDNLLEDWEDNRGIMHKGLLDKTYEIYEGYDIKYPNASDILKFISPKKYRTQIIDELIDLMQKDLIKFTKEYDGKGYVVISSDKDGETELKSRSLTFEEEASLINIDALKTETTSIFKFENAEKTSKSYALPKDKENTMHDDRFYTLALLAHGLYELRRKNIKDKTKSFNYSDYFITANNVKNAFNTKFTNRFSNSNYRR
jgi:hypothetical protein